MRTFDGHIYDSFESTARARKIIDSDDPLIECLNDGVFFKLPKQLRLLFTTILLHTPPQNKSENQSLKYFKLPEPNLPSLRPLLNANIEQLKCLSELHRSIFNDEQHYAFDRINNAIYNNQKQNLFFIDGPGGSGKTYLYNRLIEHILRNNDSAVVCASTGIACTLLYNGTTFHSAFKLLPPITSESVCYIKHNTVESAHIINSKIIIIDEVTMATKAALESINRCCQDLLQNSLLLGGKVVLLCGDLRY